METTDEFIAELGKEQVKIMITNRMGSFGLIAGGLIAGLSLTATQGCDEVGNLAEQCGLVCDEEAFINGKFNVSGIASVDAFFSATLDVSGAINATAANIEAELNGLYGLVGATGSADFKAALDAKLAAYIDVDAGLQIDFEPARCEAQLDIAAKAAAECDVDAKPGSVEVKCEGKCDIKAEAQAMCQADGMLTCRGQAPNLECEGTCEGGCQLDIAAACDGTCKGTCNGENFNGRCDGMCQGECDLGAGGSCGGSCTGTCEFTAPQGGCTGDLKARCEGSAMASGSCEGSCEGKAEPPMVKAECEATVEAKVEANVQCYPPSLSINYTFNATAAGDASVRAEFNAFINNLKVRYAALLAAMAKAEGLIDVSATLGASGKAAINGIATELQGSGDLKAKIGAGCAIATLPAAADLLTSAGKKLEGSLSGAIEVSAALTPGN